MHIETSTTRSARRSRRWPVSSGRYRRRFAVGSAVQMWITESCTACPSDKRQRIRELQRENRELRRANEILKAASGFAAEFDPRPKL